MSSIGLLFNGVWSQWAFARASKYAPIYSLIYKDDVSPSVLSQHAAIVVPFQSDHQALARHRDALRAFLALGRTIAFFGDADLTWLGAAWESRPVDNWWWARTPAVVPIVDTDRTHPLYASLSDRHAGWHHHGVYTRVPADARVIQRNRVGDVITWETKAHGGLVFASTKDPIVEHGVQQIRHLDNYCDALTEWLCGVRPTGRLVIAEDDYGVAWGSRQAPYP